MSPLAPRRVLLLGAIASFLLAPLGVAAIAHARHYSLASVRWSLGWGLALPLPGLTAWVVFGLFGLTVDLAIGGPTYLACRSRAAPARNRATLLALAIAAIVSLLVLVTWLDLWRP